MGDPVTGLTNAIILFVVVLAFMPLVAFIERVFAVTPHSAPIGARDFLLPVANFVKLLSKRASIPNAADRFALYFAPLWGLAFLLLSLATVPLFIGGKFIDVFEGKGSAYQLVAFWFLSTVSVLIAGAAGGNTLGLLSAFRLSLLRWIQVLVVAISALAFSFETRTTNLVNWPLENSAFDLGIFRHPSSCVLVLLVSALILPQVKRLDAQSGGGLIEPYSAESFGPSDLAHRLFELLARMLVPLFISAFFLGGPWFFGFAWGAPFHAFVFLAKILLCLLAIQIWSRSFSRLSYDTVMRASIFVVVASAFGCALTLAIHTFI